jgi:glycosyltransferase involved in cell wall biosynthesis
MRFYSSIEVTSLSSNINIELIFINQGCFEPPHSINSHELISHKELKHGRLPLSRARNIGLQYVTGDVIGFPDDDCWYSPNVLQEVVSYFDAHPATSAICANVYDPVLKRSYGGRPVGAHVRVDYLNLFELPISVGIFVRRKAPESVGFHFDEQLGAGTLLGSGEETDLIYRLLKSKAVVEYVGSIQVFHPVPEYQEADIAKYHRYGLGFGYLNGRIVRDGECRVLYQLGLVLVRSLGGAVLNLHRSTRRRLYWNRLHGIVQGFIRGLRGFPC